jgi:hypothetical protein
MSLKEMTSCMLHARSLSSKIWVEELNCATYIHNISPHRYFEDKTPFEAWTGEKPDVTHFHIFGSRVWAHIPFEKRKSLDPQSTPFIFVGYPDDVKGYKLIDPSTDLLIIEQTIQFEESPLHAFPLQYVDNLVLTSVIDIKDDDSTHSNATYSDTDSKDFVDADEQVVHPNEEIILEL